MKINQTSEKNSLRIHLDYINQQNEMVISHRIYKRNFVPYTTGLEIPPLTMRKLDGLPPWISKKSLDEEHTNNWTAEYFDLDESTLPRDENVITPHVIFEVNTSGDESYSI